jgi:hypothetical protein
MARKAICLVGKGQADRVVKVTYNNSLDLND